MRKKIQIKNLNKSFENVIILQNVNLEFNENESTAVIGGSGSGKSVLIKCIAGLLCPDIGSSILIKNYECSNFLVSERDEAIRESIGMLFQSNALFDSLTISENITFGVYSKIAKNGYISHNQKVELNKIAKEHLEMVELSSDNLKKYPYELSGGMQKRVAIARVMVTKPEIILLDEPTTGLDPVTSYHISKLLFNIQKKINATMITITHDPICVSEVAKKVALIDNKTVAWMGQLSDINSVNNQYMEAFKKSLIK